MTKDVLVTVSGVQMDIDDTPIELVTAGTYYLKNGKHYVVYEEQAEENEPPTKNMVKFWDGHFEMTKRGGNHAVLVFDKGEKTSMVYSTPYGPLHMDVVTKELSIAETDEEFRVYLKYDLDINYNFVSECEVGFKVKARK